MYEQKPDNVVGRKERGPGVAEQFKTLLAQYAARMNESLGTVRDRRGTVPLIDEQCRINPTCFTVKQGGPYKKEQTEGSLLFDTARVFDQTLHNMGIVSREGVLESQVAQYRGVPDELIREYEDWCQKNPEPEHADAGYVAFYIDRYKVQSACFGEVVAAHEGEEFESGNTQAELAVLVMLQKALGEQYLVVRSAPYDDYFNGLDTVVIDKATGRVICTFDELHDDVAGRAKHDRLQQKWDRNTGRMRRGKGFSLKYGLVYESGDGGVELVRRDIQELPAFPVRVHANDLNTLLGQGAIFDDFFSQREKEVLLHALTEAREKASEVAARLPENPQAIARLEHISTLITAIEKTPTE